MQYYRSLSVIAYIRVALNDYEWYADLLGVKRSYDPEIFSEIFWGHQNLPRSYDYRFFLRRDAFFCAVVRQLPFAVLLLGELLPFLCVIFIIFEYLDVYGGGFRRGLIPAEIFF